MKTSKGFFVLYVDNSSPQLLKFKSKREQTKFVNTFNRDKRAPSDGYWIDMVFDGNITFSDHSINEAKTV